jgi:hypothetical protein
MWAYWRHRVSLETILTGSITPLRVLIVSGRAHTEGWGQVTSRSCTRGVVMYNKLYHSIPPTGVPRLVLHLSPSRHSAVRSASGLRPSMETQRSYPKVLPQRRMTGSTSNIACSFYATLCCAPRQLHERLILDQQPPTDHRVDGQVEFEYHCTPFTRVATSVVAHV